jgi:hypothetical protein
MGIHRFINKIQYTEPFLDKKPDKKSVLTGGEGKKNELGAMIGWKRFLMTE